MSSTEYNYSLLEKDELKKILFEMLCEIDNICKKEDINYTLFMGTLLGAVRHSGFIPWDDDLDVAMLRKDYNKFKNKYHKYLNNEKYFLQDFQTDKYYRWGYMRIRRKHSEFIRIGQEHLKMKTGIFVDIFPLDNVPRKNIIIKLHTLFCYIIRKIMYSEVGKKKSSKLYKRIIYSIFNIIPLKFLNCAIRILSTTIKSHTHVRILTFPLPDTSKNGYPYEWFTEYEQLKFNGRYFSTIKQYRQYLEVQYGNYMKLPPQDEQQSCHPVSKFKLP